MNAEVVRPIHAFVHHEDGRLDHCAFTRLKYRRTDGQLRRSAPLHYFDVWLFLESQRAITRVGDFDRKLAGLTELDISIIDLVLIHDNGWRSASASTISCKQDRGEEQQPASQGGEKP